MPFFDIVDDVARYQLNKTEMGDYKFGGVVLGTVVKNYDEKKQGFVQVNICTRDYEENKMVWARMAFPYGGDKWGNYFVPEIGDQVILAFEQGNIDRGFIIGAVPKSNSGFVKKAFDEKNQIKRITTKNGNTIDIIDNAEGDGEKDKITITTSTSAHKLELDNEKKKMLLSDKDGKNKIEILTEKGQMTVLAAQKLTLKVGDNIELYMNGSNGSVTLKSSSLKVETTNTTEIKSNNRVTVEGSNVSVAGNSMLKLDSSGPTAIGGTPIKLG